MVRHTSGLICAPLEGPRLDELALPLMVLENTDSHKTAFTVSVDVVSDTTTGISAADRARTIRAIVDPATGPLDLARPGHIFPLRAKPGGVLRRVGQTEAGVDLARMAGFQPAGVICEILKEDGTMARRPELSESRLDAIAQRLAARGYETDRLRRVPHADGACLTRA